MDMTAETIQKIIDVSEPVEVVFDDRPYSTRNIYPVKDPVPDPLILHSLTGLVEYAKEEHPDFSAGDPCFVHIESPQLVSMVSGIHGQFSQRSIFAQAVYKIDGFPFGAWLSLEDFIVKCQVYFDKSPDRDAIMSIVSHVTSEASATYDDDGITPLVTVKNGINRERIALPNPVTLFPFRTFNEVVQPSSEFIFRIQKTREDGPPACSLFPCSGNLWEPMAVKRIKDFLKSHLTDNFTVIG